MLAAAGAGAAAVVVVVALTVAIWSSCSLCVVFLSSLHPIFVCVFYQFCYLFILHIHQLCFMPRASLLLLLLLLFSLQHKQDDFEFERIGASK